MDTKKRIDCTKGIIIFIVMSGLYRKYNRENNN